MPMQERLSYPGITLIGRFIRQPNVEYPRCAPQSIEVTRVSCDEHGTCFRVEVTYQWGSGHYGTEHAPHETAAMNIAGEIAGQVNKPNLVWDRATFPNGVVMQ
jgi:hypothetical protein